MKANNNIILIIGAGASGISAAFHLLKAGHKVVVLEANDYVGGRIKALGNGETTVIDLGASLIDNKNGELYSIAKTKGVLV